MVTPRAASADGIPVIAETRAHQRRTVSFDTIAQYYHDAPAGIMLARSSEFAESSDAHGECLCLFHGTTGVTHQAASPRFGSIMSDSVCRGPSGDVAGGKRRRKFGVATNEHLRRPNKAWHRGGLPVKLPHLRKYGHVCLRNETGSALISCPWCGRFPVSGVVKLPMATDQSR